ncbi:MAG: hypothetical protein ACE5JR_03110 [Gemmatimonadota bacterium]
MRVMERCRRRRERLALLWPAALALAGVTALGCASGRPEPPAAEGEEAPATEPTRIVVENANVLDVTVYAVRGGTVVRLGTVSAKTTAAFNLPPIFQQTAAELRFLVDPVGSTAAFLSDQVHVQPGDDLELDVKTVLDHSTISVF